MKLAAAVSFALVLATSACELSTSPELPVAAERFDPPAVYARWWSMVESCSGRSASLGQVTWYVVPDSVDLRVNGAPVDGYWESARHAIVVRHDSRLDGQLVRHEMLHALRDEPGHPRQSFLRDCGGVVACVASCLVDAGPPVVDPSALAVPPDSLRVAVLVEPTQPNTRIDGGFFTLTVTATNTSARSWRIAMPPSGDSGPSASFSFDITSAHDGMWYDDRVRDPETVNFAPGETKRRVFDLVIGSGDNWSWSLLPDTYRAIGSFGKHAGPQALFTASAFVP